MDEEIKTDRQRVDTPVAPKRTEPVWEWKCGNGHENVTKPARAPEKCEGSNPTPWGPFPCPSGDFSKTKEGIRIVEDA